MPLRNLEIQRDVLLYPASSVLIKMGNTHVLCTISMENSIPPHCRDKETGWLTAEYSMLPGSTQTRNRREVSAGKVSGRTAEIQRLIGRSLRAVTDLSAFPGMTFTVDCDVLQADGGTRTASITGAAVALYDAFRKLVEGDVIQRHPMTELVAAISVGVVDGVPVLDLCYDLDSRADVDMNIVMTESDHFVEIQGTAEHAPFSNEELDVMLTLAKDGIREIIAEQKRILQI